VIDSQTETMALETHEERRPSTEQIAVTMDPHDRRTSTELDAVAVMGSAEGAAG
jgi:hypothetical protein